MGSELETRAGPGIEVLLHWDGSAGSLLLTDRPVLLEGLGALDGWLVVTGGLVEIVDGAADGDGTLAGSAGGGVVGAKVLDDVVLDEWVLGPAVDGEVRVAVGVVGSGVGDSAGGMLVRAGRIWGRGTNRSRVPGFHPFPPTQFPLPDHWTE